VHHFAVPFRDYPHPGVSLYHFVLVPFCLRDPCVRCECAVTSSEVADLKATVLTATAAMAELVERNLTLEEDKKESNS